MQTSYKLIRSMLRRMGCAALCCATAFWLVACGGGGSIPLPGVNIRALDPDFIARKAVAYSPYRTATSEAGLGAENIPLANIKQDLQLLRQAGIGAVRVFDSSDKVASQTVQAIRELNLDMKVMLGVWIASNNSAANDAEMARAVALANANPDIIKAVSVGNETLVSWNTWNSQTTADMAAYLKSIRSRVPQPVTTDDNWAFFAAQSGEKNPDPVLKEIDFVSMHTYPFTDAQYGLWDWRQAATPAGAERAAAMMDAAIQKAKADYQLVRTHMNQYGFASMPIIVGETGWKAAPSGGETMLASPVNQKMYFDRLMAWKQESNAPKTIVYFAAFDEAWKQGDDKWGLFNAQRQARCTAQALSNNALAAESGSCAATDALYYQPPSNQGTITANRYTVYAEQSTTGEARPATAVVLNAWQNGSTSNALEVAESSGDGSSAMQINPTPLDWGWGMTWGLTGNAEVDLSNFQTGSLNFRIKTTYTGKIEVGFLTGSATDGTAYDVYRAIGPGEYGYQNDGQWHTVAIPIADIVVRGAPAYGMYAPQSRLQLNRVSNMFVLADRYAVTGKSSNANIRLPVLVDGIYWSR